MGGPEGIGVGFQGIGAYLPPDVRTNDFWGDEWRARFTERARQDVTAGVDAAVQARSADVDPEVAQATVAWSGDLFRGARERRVIPDDWKSSDMEIAACRDALADAGVSPAQVDLYYGFSHVPDYIEPTNHGRVHHALGLPLHSAAMTVAAGCASLLPMLATASRMVQAGEHERALISLSSATSRITNYGFPSSVNIGDGAVAAVIGAVEQGFGYVGQAQRTRGDLFEGVVIAPTGAEDVPWYRGDVHQSKLMITNIDRGATHVMGAHAVSLCREVVTDLYEKFGVGPEDIDFALFPQSTAWFGSALGEAVGIPEHKRLGYEDHFARFGHLIAVSLPLNLYLAYRSGRLRKGDLVLLYTPGVGFTQAAALYRWNL